MGNRVALIFAVVFFVAGVGWGTTLREVDTNFDGTIDFTDFLNFAVTYNHVVAENPAAQRNDYDGSGIVDFADFLVFVSFFGQTDAKRLEVSVEWMSDTLTVGDVDTLRVSLLKSSIPSGGCDSIGFRYGQIPIPDSIVVLRNYEQFDLPDSLVQVAEVLAVEPGSTTFTIVVSACYTFRDTMHVVVVAP